MEHPRIYAGVDTHSDTHTLALIDEHGRPLATQTFTADPTGYERLAAMIGDPDACLGVGVEGTNSYGAAPARRLVEAGLFLVKLVFRFRGGDGMLDSLSGRSRHHGEVFEGTAQARGGVVRAVRAQRGGRDPGAGVSQQGGVAHVASRLAGGTAHGDPLQSWRALFEVHGWSEARCGGALPDAWQASEQDHTPNGVSFVKLW